MYTKEYVRKEKKRRKNKLFIYYSFIFIVYLTF